MAAVNPFLLGRGLSQMTITPQSVAADGTLTDGTAGSLLATFKTFSFTQDNNTEEVSASSSKRQNMIIVDGGTSINFTGLLFSNDSVGSPVNVARAQVQNADYIKAIWNSGGIVFRCFGIVDKYEEEVSGKGAVTYSLSLSPVDIGSANPLLS